MLLQCYVGDDGVAHKVVKGYVGVNGVARKIYEPVVYSSRLSNYIATSLSKARDKLAATTVGNYALFGGGSNSSIVDAYTTDLVRSTATSLSTARSELSSTAIGNYALFGGGHSVDNNGKHIRLSAVDAYKYEVSYT